MKKVFMMIWMVMMVMMVTSCEEKKCGGEDAYNSMISSADKKMEEDGLIEITHKRGKIVYVEDKVFEGSKYAICKVRVNTIFKFKGIDPKIKMNKFEEAGRKFKINILRGMLKLAGSKELTNGDLKADMFRMYYVDYNDGTFSGIMKTEVIKDK